MQVLKKLILSQQKNNNKEIKKDAIKPKIKKNPKT